MYKRQVPSLLVLHGSAGAVADDRINGFEFTKTHGIAAVSYTHLDVYQRQAPAGRAA